jgi:hypothetical protein
MRGGMAGQHGGRDVVAAVSGQWVVGRVGGAKH